jgi:predicted ester cyclase
MAADAKTVARRWFEEVWNLRRDAVIDELMAPDSVGHLEGRSVIGPGEFRKNYAQLTGAMPDMEVVIEDIVSEGDRAAVRWRIKATHSGEAIGPPTGNPVQMRGTTWLRVRNGQIVEGWDTWNFGGLLKTFGVA